MQLSIGLTSVDLLHENGSLLARRDDLCACFGLTNPEYEELEAYMPKALPCREGYIPLGAFLAAMSHVMHAALSDAMNEQRTAEQLHELELRTHNYIFLLGALGQDLLGSPQRMEGADSGTDLGEDAEKARERQSSCADSATLKNELSAIAQHMRLLGELEGDIVQLLDSMPAQDEVKSLALHKAATSLLDLMHTTCWEYTRWYALYSASFHNTDTDSQ